MSRIRVYIAGPISKGDLATNINQATQAFLDLAAAGFAPMCPHWSAYSGPAMRHPVSGMVYAIAGATPNQMQHADWLAVDLAWVQAADAVLRLPGESAGADQETNEAERLGIPVFDSVDALRYHFAYETTAPNEPSAEAVAAPTPPEPRGIRRRIADALYWMLGY